MLASVEERKVTRPFQLLMNFLETLARYQQIHVLGESTITVKEHSHGTHERIGNPQLIKLLCNLAKSSVDRIPFLEVHTALPQCPVEIAVQKVFVSNHVAPEVITQRVQRAVNG